MRNRRASNKGWNKGERAVDKSTWLGVAIATGGILAGMMIEGGKIAQVLQPTAAMIVFGGTLGAVMLQFPMPTVLDGFRHLPHAFFEPKLGPRALIDQIVVFANKARKQGIVSLDADLGEVNDPFLNKALTLAVDGTESQELRRMMELEMDNQAERDEKVPQFFEAAGGYAPTVGILGAVIGLIQVMQHLSDINEVGRGIAVAFVATIYGVASANLFFLPIAGKLKQQLRESHVMREMMLEGVASILDGMNPRMLETKLLGFVAPRAKAGKPEPAEEVEAQPSAALAEAER